MEPYVPFAPLTLPPDAAIDLQLHTTFSDGRWSVAQLLDHVAGVGFALVAITDHDRPDTIDVAQRLAGERGVHVMPAVEMSSLWEGDPCDVLCFGIGPGSSALARIAEDTYTGQAENVRAVYEALQRNGYRFPRADEILAQRAGGLHQFEDLVVLLHAHGYTEGVGRTLDEAGFQWITADLATIVDAAHASGALALIAHPGRGDGFVRLDAERLDHLRATIPIDGIEARHPSHTPAQVDAFVAYARTHGLLVSAGSDSHGPPGTMPIEYPAETCRELLDRLGILVR